MAGDDTASKLRSLTIDRSGDGAGEDVREGGGLSVLAAVGIAAAAAVFGAVLVWWLLQGAAPAERDIAVETATATPPAVSTSAAPAAPTPVSARPAGRLVASGYVTARRRATVSSDITGRLSEILVEEGDAVEQGQVLARLDDVRAKIDLDLAEARAEAARAAVDRISADLAETRRVFGRTSRLIDADVLAEARLTEARAQVDALEAELERTKANVKAAELDVASRADLVERHLVRAPFSGVVIEKNAQAGEIVSPTSAGGGFTRTGVYTLVDMASLEIEVDVNEGSIERIRPGMRAEAILDAYADWRIPAEVVAIIPTADRSRGTIQVRVAFIESDPRILPDMAAKVTFLSAGKE